MARYLLDTSALVAFLSAEAGGSRVARLLASEEVLVAFPTLIESYYIALRRESEIVARERQIALRQLPATFLWAMDEPTVSLAARLKAHHKLSFADAIIAAFAGRQQAILVHRDPEFVALGDLIQQEVLPLRASAQPE